MALFIHFSAQSTQQSSTQEVATHTKITQNKDEVDRAKMEQVKREKEIREEQQRVEQMKREQEMKQQQMRQEQERQLALEQQRLANEAREEALRVQKQLEQQEREQHAREQQMREQQLREEEMRKQQMRDQQMQEQQMREQQMKEQQMKEQQMREQQMREQQVREQQMREQQMRDQQMRDQQMQQQQMQQQQMQQQQMQQQQMQQQQMQQQQMQQQHFQQQQTNMSRTTTETSSFSQQQSLHESNLSMQVKSGGFISGGQEQQVEGYTSSLKPTSEGELIRTQGDLQYSQTNMQQSGMEQVQLRKTSGTKDIKDTVRQSGVFVGIAGDHNALVSEMFDNEKHSVSDMVKHFSKIKPGDIPQNIMPQHYQMQHAPPSLSELQDQAKDRQFSYQKKDQVDSSSTMTYKEQKEAEEKAKLFERRTSLKDFMLMEGEKSSNINIIDPSNILQGAKASRWQTDSPFESRFSLRGMSSSPTMQMQKSRPIAPKPFVKSNTDYGGKRPPLATGRQSEQHLPPKHDFQKVVTPDSNTDTNPLTHQSTQVTKQNTQTTQDITQKDQVMYTQHETRNVVKDETDIKKERLLRLQREEELEMQRQEELQKKHAELQRQKEVDEKQMMEEKLKEQELRKQEMREQEARKQQIAQQQMREQQIKQQALIEQEKRERQMKQQYMREQQIRDQEERDKQIREQQIKGQQIQLQRQQDFELQKQRDEQRKLELLRQQERAEEERRQQIELQKQLEMENQYQKQMQRAEELEMERNERKRQEEQRRKKEADAKRQQEEIRQARMEEVKRQRRVEFENETIELQQRKEEIEKRQRELMRQQKELQELMNMENEHQQNLEKMKKDLEQEQADQEIQLIDVEIKKSQSQRSFYENSDSDNSDDTQHYVIQTQICYRPSPLTITTPIPTPGATPIPHSLPVITEQDSSNTLPRPSSTTGQLLNESSMSLPAMQEYSSSGSQNNTTSTFQKTTEFQQQYRQNISSCSNRTSSALAHSITPSSTPVPQSPLPEWQPLSEGGKMIRAHQGEGYLKRSDAVLVGSSIKEGNTYGRMLNTQSYEHSSAVAEKSSFSSSSTSTQQFLHPFQSNTQQEQQSYNVAPCKSVSAFTIPFQENHRFLYSI